MQRWMHPSLWHSIKNRMEHQDGKKKGWDTTITIRNATATTKLAVIDQSIKALPTLKLSGLGRHIPEVCWVELKDSELQQTLHGDRVGTGTHCPYRYPDELSAANACEAMKPNCTGFQMDITSSRICLRAGRLANLVYELRIASSILPGTRHDKKALLLFRRPSTFAQQTNSSSAIQRASWFAPANWCSTMGGAAAAQPPRADGFGRTVSKQVHIHEWIDEGAHAHAFRREVVRCHTQGCLDAVAPRLAKRQKPILFLHVSHGGGTFMCETAREQQETIVGKHVWNCNVDGDSPLKGSARIMGCAARQRAVRTASFTALERGFEGELEFCPAKFDHVLLLRNPLDRMASVASLFEARMPIRQLLDHLERGTMDVEPYSQFFKRPGESVGSGVGD